MTLQNRIKFSFLILGFFLIFISATAFVGNKNIFSATTLLTYRDLPSIVENSKMNGIAKDMRSLIYRLHLKNSTAESVIKTEERFLELYEQYSSSKREYLATPYVLESDKNNFTKIDNNFEDWINISKKLISIKKSNFNSPEFEILLTSEYRDAANKYLSSMTEFLDELSANSKRQIETLESTNKKNELILVSLSLLGLAVAVLGSILISKSTGKVLENLYATFRGKYQSLDENCKLGDNLSRDNLNRVDNQASALNQTSSAAQKTYKSLEGVSLQAKRLKDQTEVNKEFLSQSSQALNKLDNAIRAVDEINEKLTIRLEKSNSELSDIIGSFKEIEIKTNMINDIVFQTKLLSFNASVEAARAGEHGKGFTVVANEINELAAKSGKSSTEIFSLLQVSQKSINQIIEKSTSETSQIVNEFNDAVEECINLSKESKNKIQQTVSSIDESFLFVSEISTSTNQQVSAISQISDAMISLQSINKENEDGALESARLLAEIINSANQIDTSIKHLVYGNNSTVGG